MAVARAIPRFGALMWWLQLGVIQGVTLYGSLLMSVVCDFLCSNTITIVMSLNNRGLSYIRRSLLGWIENLSSPGAAPASFHVQPAADLPFLSLAHSSSLLDVFATSLTLIPSCATFDSRNPKIFRSEWFQSEKCRLRYEIISPDSTWYFLLEEPLLGFIQGSTKTFF